MEAGFYSDVVECLPLDPAAQVRFPPRAVTIFLHPVTFVVSFHVIPVPRNSGTNFKFGGGVCHRV